MKEDSLIKLANDIKDAALRENVISIIKEPKLSMIEIHGTPSPSFGTSPASKRRHHSYENGLVVHTYCVAKVALNLCDIVEEVYGVKVDRDVVLASALLHDLFKYVTYTQIYPGKYGHSKIGERLDHLSLIVGELYARKFPLDVMHAVAAHHGDASPIEPRTIEALIVHLADNADAEMNDKVFFAAKDILKECLGIDMLTLPKEVSPFKVVAAKKDGGCEEVRRKFSSLL
jgi:7,8-dihydroneopterin 2',3'-cyclic phosphate phosphodiesterase